MRRLLAILLALGGCLLTVAASPSPPASPSPSPTASSTPVPIPTPTPSNGQVNLSPASGQPGDAITVSGSRFRPGEAVTIFWDNRDHSLAGATADSQGSFSAQVKAPDDPAGQHVVCAQEPNQVCATFQLQARTPSSPSPSPSATTTPATPAATPTPLITTPMPLPTATDSGRVSAISMLLQPPLVIFPILLLLALLAASVFWIRAGSRRSSPAAMASATVKHRGPSGPGSTPVPPSAFTPSAAPGPPPAPDPPPPPPAPKRSRPAGSDGPPDLPQAGD